MKQADIVLTSVNGCVKQGLLQMLNTAGNIYLGGGPDPYQLTGARWEHGFRGCVHSLSFQGKDVNFKEDRVSSANILPCDE